jgi:hypothetical protein
MNYLSIFGLLLILASPFGIANTLLDKLSLCTKNKDDTQRLACYDEVVDKNVNTQPKQYKVKHQAPLQDITTEQEDNTNQQQAEFGQENDLRSKGFINQLQATINKIEKTVYGKLVITLDNQQVWRQTDSTRLNLRKNNVIIIERGAFGSFFISKENANKRIRAKRMR